MIEKKIAAAGKKRCQIPETIFASEVSNRHELEPTMIVDGRLKGGGGLWCYMCDACHAEFGVGLGVGKGTRFQQLEYNGEWRLVKPQSQRIRRM